MTNLFDNASFGTRCLTRDGGNAVYLAHIMYNDTHKIIVQGFEKPFIYNPDGRRRGTGKHMVERGMGLDIMKILE